MSKIDIHVSVFVFGHYLSSFIREAIENKIPTVQEY